MYNRETLTRRTANKTYQSFNPLFDWSRSAELSARCSKRRFSTSEQALDWRNRNNTGRSGLCLKSQNVVPYRTRFLVKFRNVNSLRKRACQKCWTWGQLRRGISGRINLEKANLLNCSCLSPAPLRGQSAGTPQCVLSVAFADRQAGRFRFLYRPQHALLQHGQEQSPFQEPATLQQR